MPKFSLYLIKPGFLAIPRYSINENAVKENENSVFCRSIILEDNYQIEKHIEDIGFESIKIIKAKSTELIYIKTVNNHNPWWKGFWKIEDELNLQNASAVVIKEIEGRQFVFTHGFGRYFLNPFCLEYDFGLRTAVNLIDDSKLKTAGLYTPSEIGLKTTKQSGKNAKVDEYDINIYNTMLKNIAGSVKEDYKHYFDTIAGADCVSFSYSGTDIGLFDIANMLYKISKGNSYLENGLYWIDNFKPVKDYLTIAELDHRLLNAINERSDNVLILYPEVFDSKKDIYFSYSGIKAITPKDTKYPFLSNEQYYTILHENLYTSIREIQKQYIDAFDKDGWGETSSYSVYQCIYYENKLDNTQYYIEGGIWYSISNDFFKEIESRYEQLFREKIDFDFTYNRKEILKESRRLKLNKEYVFNMQLAEHLNQFDKAILLDTDTVKYNRSQIEVCDVLYKSAGVIFLIHNKYKYGSSALSHLFSQGNVSANCLADIKFRKLVNEKIDIPELKFLETEKIDRDPINIVYGIITKLDKNGNVSIPIFSKINLKLFSDSLKTLGYTTKLTFFVDS